MKKNLSRGFTLIELLVVIAIIGILASVVLASLNSARNKGSAAAVKASMANMRPQAEIYYDRATTDTPAGGGGRYSAAATTTCNAASSMFADSTIVAMIAQITAQSSVAPVCNTDTSGQYWAVSTTMKDGTTYCVDNSGASKAGSTSLTTGKCS